MVFFEGKGGKFGLFLRCFTQHLVFLKWDYTRRTTTVSMVFSPKMRGIGGAGNRILWFGNGLAARGHFPTEAPLFVPQRLDGVEFGGLSGRVISEKDSHSGREYDCGGQGRKRDETRPAEKSGDASRKEYADDDA